MEPLVPLLQKTQQADMDGPISCSALTLEHGKFVKTRVFPYLTSLWECNVCYWDGRKIFKHILFVVTENCSESNKYFAMIIILIMICS
jgi:hypothetical protein